MTAAATIEMPPARAAGHVRALSLRLLVTLLFASLAFDNVLLLGLLGYPPLMVGALAIIIPAALGWLCWRMVPAGIGLDASLLLLCLGIAILLLLLGGEGRLFYATNDWQVRDAVLRDLGTHRWPFDYWLRGQAHVLRAPVGMYLVPALLGGANQFARDWALLGHNALVLTLILAIGASLFPDRHARLIALVVFVAFSGLDVIGNMLNQSITGAADWDHIERWGNNFQFSSTITLIFWVPQHAFAGWTAALCVVLWRRGLVPVGLVLASVPLVALWSPFAIFGALPFAIFAGLHALITRRWDGRDVALAATGAITAIPSLLYLHAAADSVGGGLRPPSLFLYLLVIGLEILPFLWPLLRDRTCDRAIVFIAGGWLCIQPVLAIGSQTDFQMRASIVPLAILALSFADWMTRLTGKAARTYAVAIVAIGSVTGAVEIHRSLVSRPSPAPLCSLLGMWPYQTGMAVTPNASYFAPRAALPAYLAPMAPVERAGTDDPDRCWDRPWHQVRNR